MEIAREIGLDFIPKIVVGKLSEAEREDLRLRVNVYRRHLSQAQMRELIAWELRRDQHASDNVIAGRTGVDHKTVGGRPAAAGVRWGNSQLEVRNDADGKRYPARKPVVYTSGEAQAREVARLLEELGDDAPDEPINVRDLRTLKWQKEREARISQAKGSTRLGDDFLIWACDLRKLGERIAPGTADLILTDPPWEAKLGPELAQAAVRLLKPDGILACSTGVYYMPYFLGHFQQAGLRYEWTVAEVHRFRAIRNAGQVKNQWTPVLVLRNGHAGRLRLNGVLEDVFRSEECDKSLHAWQQDVRTAVALIRSLCLPGGWWWTSAWARAAPPSPRPWPERTAASPAARSTRSWSAGEGPGRRGHRRAGGRGGTGTGDGLSVHRLPLVRPVPRPMLGMDTEPGADPMKLTEAPVLPPLPAQEYEQLRDRSATGASSSPC